MDNEEGCDLVENCEYCGKTIEWNDDQCDCTECIPKCAFCKKTMCEDCALPIYFTPDSWEEYTCKDHAFKYELYDVQLMFEGSSLEMKRWPYVVKVSPRGVDIFVTEGRSMSRSFLENKGDELTYLCEHEPTEAQKDRWVKTSQMMRKVSKDSVW